MSHFYKIEGKSVTFLPNVKSPAQARAAGGTVCSSVTTKLSIAPNAFLDDWGKTQIILLAREHPTLHPELVKGLMYGTRTDVDGKKVSASQFGTAVHTALENALNASVKGELVLDQSPYATFVRPFMSWFHAEEMELLQAERMVGCERRQVAGMIDVVAKDSTGQVVLLDFKTRETRGKSPATKSYEKDAMQLAVEAQIVQEMDGLDYTPRIISVIIDASTGNTAAKLWTLKAQRKAEVLFDAINVFYNTFVVR